MFHQQGNAGKVQSRRLLGQREKHVADSGFELSLLELFPVKKFSQLTEKNEPRCAISVQICVSRAQFLSCERCEGNH